PMKLLPAVLVLVTSGLLHDWSWWQIATWTLLIGDPLLSTTVPTMPWLSTAAPAKDPGNENAPTQSKIRRPRHTFRMGDVCAAIGPGSVDMADRRAERRRQI